VELCSCPSDLPLPYHEYLEKQNRRDRDRFEMRPTEVPAAQEPVRPTEDPSYAGPRIGEVSDSDPSPRHRNEITSRYETFTPMGTLIDVFG
jgi:hypothetical protein